MARNIQLMEKAVATCPGSIARIVSEKNACRLIAVRLPWLVRAQLGDDKGPHVSSTPLHWSNPHPARDVFRVMVVAQHDPGSS